MITYQHMLHTNDCISPYVISRNSYEYNSHLRPRKIHTLTMLMIMHRSATAFFHINSLTYPSKTTCNQTEKSWKFWLKFLTQQAGWNLSVSIHPSYAQTSLNMLSCILHKACINYLVSYLFISCLCTF